MISRCGIIFHYQTYRDISLIDGTIEQYYTTTYVIPLLQWKKKTHWPEPIASIRASCRLHIGTTFEKNQRQSSFFKVENWIDRARSMQRQSVWISSPWDVTNFLKKWLQHRQLPFIFSIHSSVNFLIVKLCGVHETNYSKNSAIILLISDSLNPSTSLMS